MIYLLVACGPISLEFTPETNGCENYDFDNPAPSELILVEDGDDILIQRTMVFKSANATFTPTYSVDDYKIYIREYWEGEVGDSFCWMPTVRVSSPPNRALEFWWYDGDADISEDVLQYEP